MESGAPKKAFETGKVFLISRDTTEDQQMSDSYTSFEKYGNGWKVNMDWKGRAESSMFEDIRKNSDYTSFALFSNNLELGTTIKNNEEFEKYYNALAVGTPLINFLIYRRVDLQYLAGPIATIARAGTFDFVVTRFVDPVRYSKDEICDPEKVDNAIHRYQAMTGISIAQSVWTTISPYQGLFPFIGSKLKMQLLQKSADQDPAGWLAKAKASAAGKFLRSDVDVASIEKIEKNAQTLTKTIEKAQTDQIYALENLQRAKSAGANPSIIAGLDADAFAAHTTMATKTAELHKLESDLIEIRGLKTTTGIESLNKIEKSFGNLYKALLLIDPVQLGKQVIASNGFRYVSLCKDTSYKILAYQKISAEKTSANLQTKFDQLGKIDIGKQLNLTGALGGMGKKLEEKELTELLNLRAFTENAYGQLQPEDVYYIHLDGATQQWFGVYNKLNKNGCFRECHDSKNGFVCADETGVTYTDKQTGKSVKLSASKDRGLLTLMMQDLARTLVPNRIISAGLDNSCSNSEILAVEPGRLGGTLMIKDDSCGTMACLRSQLKQLKSDITDDLSASGFGDVVAVYTDQGRITANNGKVRFIRGVPEEDDEKNETVGIELQAPSIDALGSATLAQMPNNYISIMGDGSVSIKGNINTAAKVEEVQVGKLLTIITEKGKIEFDEEGQRLVVALYMLARTRPIDTIKTISTSIRENTDENGNLVPAIAITGVVPKVGGEADAKELNNALNTIQTGADGKEGGFTVLETADKRYTISTDANGKPILTVFDKNTGEKTDYQITGPLRREGNDLIVPTDKGEFRFNLDMKNGQPTLSVNGPDGLAEIAALLAAKGPGGIIAFDPRTGLWYALNGQDIPWNDEFAKRGLSLYNTQDGTRGVASDNMFGYPRNTGSGSTSTNSPFSIPSFPTNGIYALLMLATILTGVVFVRFRKEYY
jgi:hypothetical protein